MARSKRNAWLICSLGLAWLAGCRKAQAPTQLPPAPSVRIALLSTVAGALEPCGCRKDMLGGVTHAAAVLETSRAEAPHQLVLGAGPLFFQDPQLDRSRGDQDRWKAEALADSFAKLGLAAWAPGANDFAAGSGVLAELVRRSHARPIAANLAAAGSAGADAGATLPVAATALFDVGGYHLGVAGIGARGPLGESSDANTTALAAAERKLAGAGAQIRIALIAAPRGDALRLLERVPGFAVALLGKPVEQGDANDAPPPPSLVGGTLVVETSNHLQTLGYVDLFVRGDSFDFRDGMGIESSERRESLERRMADLDQRLARWRNERPPATERIAAAERDREQLRAELAPLEAQSTAPTPVGSFFRYHSVEVREQAGSDPAVADVASAYYRRVNDHNREAFKDRLPLPAPTGTPHYVGESACASCHAGADAFWKTMQHAHAYQTLSSQFKEFNLDCVGCHVTGYDRPGGSTVTHVAGLKDVQCEACHGPGSQHVESGGDTALIRRDPDPAVCRGCHHPPHTVDDWDVQAARRLILGPGHGAPATGSAG
jgi:hypothetical protein